MEKPQLDQIIHSELLCGFKVVKTDKSDGSGFRISVFEGKDFVATCSVAKVIILDNLPEDVRNTLQKYSEQGVDTYIENVAVEEKYKNRGLGTELWKLSLSTLLAKTNGRTLDLVEDDSVGKWTERTLPKVIQFGKGLDYKVDILWSGIVDNKNSWLVCYDKQKRG